MAEAEVGKFPCPDCDVAPYKDPRGLASHRKSAHGYVSPNAAKFAKYKVPKAMKATKLKATVKEVYRPPKTTAKKQAGGRPRKLPFVCPECGTGFITAKGRGRHRQAAHGIVGKAESSRLARLRRQKLKEQGKQLEPMTAHIYPPTKGSTNGNTSNSSESNNSFWIGKATERAETIFATYSDRTDLGEAEFAARCLGILSGLSKTLRKKYRISD